MTAVEEVPAVVSDWNREDCTSWCTDTPHNHDPACWGEEGKHEVFLSMEDNFPRNAVQPYDPVFMMGEDAPRAAVYAYREQPGCRSVIYLHLYRSSSNEHLELDCAVHLTAEEAARLAKGLLSVAAVVAPVPGGAE
jgi:hypothetical protein